MLRFYFWELEKLFYLKSVRLGAATAFLLPVIWSMAPGLKQVYGLVLVSGWQVPALALLAGMEFLFPFLVAMSAAEVLGAEVAMGTLKPVLLRPISRTRLIVVKLLAALTYPFALLSLSLLGGMVAGLFHGFGGFYGGTGLGPGGFAGVGYLAPGAALGEILRAYLLAGATLLPLAALAVFYAAIFLSTTASALATLATVLLMRMLVVFPAVVPLLLTTYLNLYLKPERAGPGLLLLAIYTLGFGLLAVLFFEKKDI